MKKLFASMVFVAFFAAYVAYQELGNTAGLRYSATAEAPAQNATTAGSPAKAVQTGAAQPSAPEQSTPAAQPTPATAPVQPQGRYKDGTYTGNSVYVYYGNVQVQATVQNGRLADVQFLQYPSDRSTSRFINEQAMPILKQEAIQVQSAQVDGVSGASDTSAGFQQSLASALAQAKA